MQKPLIEIRGAIKRYNGTVAVNAVSLNIPRGVIFGLLGPNGAGKTSLIRILTRITAADEGEVLFDGQPLENQHAVRIGYMPEERGLYKKMKTGEHLLYLAQLRGLDRKTARTKIDEWIVRFNIGHWWNKKIDELSKGMQQIVQFIATVVHEPSLLIFDEPFSGLDPINSNLIKDEIHRLNDSGTTVIFSTHRMEQVEEICTSIALINQGELILHGEVKALKQMFKKNQFHVCYQGNAADCRHPDFDFTILTAEEMTVTIHQHHRPNELLNYLTGKLEISSFTEILPSLNEIFIDQVKTHNQK